MKAAPSAVIFERGTCSDSELEGQKTWLLGNVNAALFFLTGFQFFMEQGDGKCEGSNHIIRDGVTWQRLKVALNSGLQLFCFSTPRPQKPNSNPSGGC